VKDFARIMVLIEEGFNDTELMIITGLSEKTIQPEPGETQIDNPGR